MSKDQMKTLVKQLPKAELHIHIEGSLQPELLFSLAQKNKVEIAYKTLEEVRAAYNFGNLDEFLKLYYQGMSVLVNACDFEELAYQYAKRASEDNVVYSEPFFDPQGHLCRGIPLRTVYEGLTAGFKRAESDFGIRCALIFSFLRHLPAAESLLLVTDPHPDSEDSKYARQLFAEKAFVAVGLDSSEKPFPPEMFEQLYTYCKEVLQVPHLVAHAGEEGPAEYIRTALDKLHCDRIDHGVACRTDAALRDTLRERQIPLTVCPWSNVDLRVFKTKAECASAVMALLRDGLRVTLNSDDPSYFGGGAYMNAQFDMMVDHDPSTTPAELKQLAINSFLSTFLPEEEKKALCDRVDKVYAEVMSS